MDLLSICQKPHLLVESRYLTFESGVDITPWKMMFGGGAVGFDHVRNSSSNLLALDYDETPRFQGLSVRILWRAVFARQTGRPPRPPQRFASNAGGCRGASGMDLSEWGALLCLSPPKPVTHCSLGSKGRCSQALWEWLCVFLLEEFVTMGLAVALSLRSRVPTCHLGLVNSGAEWLISLWLPVSPQEACFSGDPGFTRLLANLAIWHVRI